MKIYRVTMQRDLLVEAEDEVEAEEIARENFEKDVELWHEYADCFAIEEIEKIEQLSEEETGSLPWRDWSRRNEADQTVDEIIKMNLKNE